MHRTATKDQVRTRTKFIKYYTGNLNDENSIPDQDLPNAFNDPVRFEAREPNTVLLLSQDYSNRMPLFYFGKERPSSENFKNNLMLNMCVMAEISRN